MIILDTNVVSEAMRPAPSTKVMEWLANQPVSDLCTTAVNEAEVFSGIARMPVGRRRREFQERAELMFREYFDRGVLAFDSESARQYAVVFAIRFGRGHPIEHPDAQIAAIARLHNATLATRNLRDFEDCGVHLVNPWEPTT
jgi:predicted nucleic acid-binding protein